MIVYHLLDTAPDVGNKHKRLKKKDLYSRSFHFSLGKDNKVKHVACEIMTSATEKKQRKEGKELQCNFK